MPDDVNNYCVPSHNHNHPSHDNWDPHDDGRGHQRNKWLTSNVCAGYSPRLLRACYASATRRPIFRTKTLLSLTNGEVVKT